MAYENRAVQSSTSNSLPTGTDPLVDNTASGDVQAIKVLDGAAGSTTPVNTGAGVATNALRATLASDDPAVVALQILDNFISGSRGLVTEDNSAASLTALQVIDNFISGSRGLVTEDNSASILTALQTIDNFISGSRGLVTEDNSAAALTALQLIDDTVATVASAITAKGLSMAGTDGTNARILKTDSAGELQVDVLTMPTVAVTQSGTWDEVGINDSGNSITVDAPTGTPVNVQIGDGTRQATVRDTGTSDSLNVAIVDASGNQVTSFGGGTQYTEADVDASITGTAVMWEDTSDTLRVASAAKPLPVNIISGAGSGGTAIQDGAVFTPDTTNLTPVGGYRDDTAPAVVTEGDAAAARITEYRALHVNLRDASGNEVAVGGGTQYTEDAAAAANPVGTALMLVREDARAGSLVSTDGDNVAARGNNKGELYVKTTDSDTLLTTIDADTGNIATSTATVAGAVSGTEMQVDVVAALPAGTNAIGKLAANSGVDIGDVDVLSVIPGTGATNLGKAIDTATGATDTGVLTLATRDDALSALTPIEGDNVQLRTDANGALWTHDDALDAALSGSELQVDVVAALPAGDNNIGNVDIVTVPAPLSTTGGGTEATALRVTVASDSTGVLSVDDNGGNLSIDDGGNSITVDNGGTFATQATLQAGTNAVGKLLPPDVDVTTHTNYAKKYYTSAGAATDGIIWSPAAGKRWHVVSWSINVSAACTVTIEDDLGAGDSPVFKAEFAANSGIVQYFGEKYPLASGEDAADLLITTTAGNVYVTVTGYEV